MYIMIISSCILFRMSILWTKILEKIKINIAGLIIFFPRKLCLLRDNLETYGRARRAANDGVMGRRKYAI